MKAAYYKYLVGYANGENVGKRTASLHGIFDAACGNLASLN